MSRAYSAIRTDISSFLQDSSNAVFSTAELDTYIPNALIRLSHSIPWQYKVTKTTTADSYDITLSAGDKWRLTGIEKLEYLVDKNPRRFRGFTRFADVVSINVDSRPSSAVSVYFFMNKVHLLSVQIGTSDTAGAVKTQGAVGDVTLALKSLGTGTIDETASFTIAGDTTTYYVTSQATIAANEATVSIWPSLAAVAAVDAVVTLSLSSTLETQHEDFLVRLVAARAAISKSTLSYQQVNTAITTIANAATAIADIAAMITTGLASSTSGKAQAALGATAVILANAEYDKMVTAIELQKTAVASGLALANTIPVGGGLGDYLATANGDAGEAQARMLNGQAYLQEASADHSNAAQYYSAAAAELRAAGEKAQEANANLSLVATRLRVSDNGRNYENWGRVELAKVEQELDALNGYRHSVRYPRD